MHYDIDPTKVLFTAFLLSQNKQYFAEQNFDLGNPLTFSDKVNNCQFNLYIWAIKMISAGLSIEEILKRIDLLDSNDFDDFNESQCYAILSSEEKKFVKNDIKHLLKLRINNERKDNNE